MMVSRGWCVLAGFLLLLAGCASGPPAVPDTRALFLDDQFKPVPGLVVESQEQIFALAPELADRLRAQSRQSGSTEQRLKTLLAQIYTDAGIRLDYNVGHSTGAAETWANKRGDCLSLTILAYSAARVLDVEARMQEVPGPALVDRRGDIDFVTGHVNLYVRARNRVSLGSRVFEPGGFIVDFQPHSAQRNLGLALEESEVLARFYNNRASEHLAQGQTDEAYLYYRAAASADPRYAPVFSNLAVLYQRKGLHGNAEAALRYAVALKGNSDVALKGLHQLLLSQGRHVQAAEVAQELRKWQDASPYYWLERGRLALNSGDSAGAVDALERAEALSSGFAELHYLLALTYARAGEADKAQAQMSILRGLSGQDAALALLAKKLQQ